MSDLPAVLFVTSELVGPFRNGGIGTATTGLVETVAGLGCKTTVLYTGALWHVEIDMAPWIRSWRRIGVELVALGLGDMARLAGPVRDQGLGSAWLVYEFVRARQFDIVHFNETLGEGLYVLTARHLGAHFPETRMLLGLHSPTRWIMRLNRQLVDNVVYGAFDWAERQSVRAADVLWGPSAYLIQWLRDEGWTLPAEIACRQYVMPTGELFVPGTAKFAAADTPPAPRRLERVAELVFFGRLEERKGLRGFCSALDLLADRLVGAGIAVTFMGKPVRQGDETSADWLRRRGADWRFPWRLETGFGQREALAYLQGRDCLAVMPSPWDNSPCTIYEAMQNGIPFLASATGGIPELVHPDDRARALFADTPTGLADALAVVLTSGAATVRPRLSPAERRRDWQAVHTAQRPPAAAVPSASPRLLVLIDHDGDAEHLAVTIESLRQTLGSRIVGLVVLAARQPRHEMPAGIALIDAGRERRVEQALAAAIGALEAPFLLCLTAGATLIADTLPAFDRALAAADLGSGLIPAARTADGRIVPPLGGRVFGFYEGFAFTGAALLTRQAVLAALAARGTLHGAAFAGLVDLVAAADGALWPFPEPLLRLPAGFTAGPVTLDGARVAAFDGADPVERGLIAAVGFAAYRRSWLNRKRRLLLLAAALPGFQMLVRAVRATIRLRRR